MIELGELILKKGGSVDPLKFPNEKFQYYSIPAYDKNEAEIVYGKEIGSSKKLFLPNDVLLSRIVPHIRRCWIVGINNGYRQIGSSEWITFRSDKITPSFLRFYLMSNDFNDKFLKTIKGVGGSLMRADPSQVAKFKIPLPPLEQQKKIAAILDAADAYRQKTKALIAKYDELTQSLFLDMFGDPVKNEKGWEKVELKSLCSFKKKSIKPDDIVKGENYVALDSIEKVTGKITTSYNVDKGELKSNKFWFDKSYILYGKLRPYLNKVALPDFEGVCSTDIIPIQPIENKSNRFFISSILRHSSFVAFADERSSGANLPRISPSEVEKYLTISPPLNIQNQFAERVQAIEVQKAQVQASLEKAEDLFNSLLQRAFKGELV